MQFYKWIADEHRRHSAAGRSPAKEIAKERGVPTNRVHQWFYKSRELARQSPGRGFLEPSPRSRLASS